MDTPSTSAAAFPLPAFLRMKGAVPDYKATAFALCEEVSRLDAECATKDKLLKDANSLIARKNGEAAMLQSSLDSVDAALDRFHRAGFLFRLKFLFTGNL